VVVAVVHLFGGTSAADQPTSRVVSGPSRSRAREFSSSIRSCLARCRITIARSIDPSRSLTPNGMSTGSRPSVTTLSKERYKTFEEFYPFYLSQHSNRTCRRLHVVGTLLGLVTLVYLLVTLNFTKLWLPFVIGYSFAWVRRSPLLTTTSVAMSTNPALRYRHLDDTHTHTHTHRSATLCSRRTSPRPSSTRSSASVATLLCCARS